MGIPVNDSLSTNAPKPVDERFLKNGLIPYATTAEAIAAISTVRRFKGLIVLVNDQLWWWIEGVSDADLVPYGLFTRTFTADGNYVLKAGQWLEAVSIKSTVGINIKIGITDNGGEIEPGYDLPANASRTFRSDLSVDTDTAIYFNGITGTGATVRVWIKKI